MEASSFLSCALTAERDFRLKPLQALAPDGNQPVFLALLDIDLVESGAQTLRHLLRVIIRPEMHEKEPRLLVEHVAMQCRHLDTMPKEFLEHRIHFLSGEHKIACDCNLPTAGRLEVDGDR